MRRLGVNFGAEFLHESLGDGLFGVAASDCLVNLLEHGGGRGAAHVIALRQYLVAVAHAHEFAADLAGAIHLLLRGQRRHQER